MKIVEVRIGARPWHGWKDGHLNLLVVDRVCDGLPQMIVEFHGESIEGLAHVMSSRVNPEWWMRLGGGTCVIYKRVALPDSVTHCALRPGKFGFYAPSWEDIYARIREGLPELFTLSHHAVERFVSDTALLSQEARARLGAYPHAAARSGSDEGGRTPEELAADHLSGWAEAGRLGREERDLSGEMELLAELPARIARRYELAERSRKASAMFGLEWPAIPIGGSRIRRQTEQSWARCTREICDEQIALLAMVRRNAADKRSRLVSGLRAGGGGRT